jgi:hypothetical protein
MASPNGSRSFFRHSSPIEKTNLEETTRLMCAAAYLDETFANRVIQEIVDNEHRAVVPSVGFDLNPVVRHCLRARSLRLRRDALLTGVLVLGLLVSWQAVVGWMLLGLAMLIVVWAGRQNRKLAIGLGAGAVLLLVLCGGGLGVLTSLFPSAGSSQFGSDLGQAPQLSQPDAGLTPDGLLLRVAVIAVVTLTVQMALQMYRYRTLTEDLAQGRPHQAPTIGHSRVRRRVERAAAAQWGNVTLHAAPSPFLGSGDLVRDWSMALDLRRSPAEGGGPVDSVDPVALHERVRARLRRMGGSGLPEPERVPGLALMDHVVATGERPVDDPLLDPARVPYSQASPEAIEAIIRYPQGSLRYYQRSTVGAEGKDVRTPGRELVVGRQDQEIAVSTFLYLAVEGGMLYAEFVATVLRPIRDSYHLIDRLVPERLLGRALRESLSTMLIDFVAAPVRLVASLISLLGYGSRMNRADRDVQEYRVYDYGAWQSIRQLAASPRMRTYLQLLDAEKYYKLVERAITGAVLEYLDEHGVDTAEYQNRATMIHNSGLVIGAGAQVTAPVNIAAGTGASATLTSPRT